MAHKITTMLAATYFLSSSQTLYLTNDLTSSLTSVSVPNGYYTTYLINTSSTDFFFFFVDKTWCILQKTRERLGNYFDFGLTADGKTQIRYRGYSTGSISFVSSSAMKNALGFTETVLTFYSGSVLTSSYQPYGAVFSINSSDSDGWQTEYSQTAYAETPMGIVYGFKDDYFKLTRKFTLKFLPRNQTAKNALGGNPATVAMSEYTTASAQSSNYNHTPPSFEDSYYIQPFTFQHFLRLAPGYPVRTAFGTFQENLSGSNLRYDAVYLRPNFINKKGGYQVPSIRNYDNLVDVPDIEVISCNSGALSSERVIYVGPTIVTSSSIFSPSDISSLYAWYRGDLVTYDGSNKVSVWPDKSGNGNHLSQSNSAKQPVYFGSISSRNNQPGIHGHSGAYLQAENFTLRTYKTIFIVVGSTGSMSYVSSLYNGGVEYSYVYHPGNATFYNRDNSAGQHYITNTGGNFFQANVNHTFEYDGVTPTLYRSSSNVAGTATGAATADNYATGSFSLFSSWAGGSASTMQILEVLVYNKALNSTERTQVWNYLTTRYGS